MQSHLARGLAAAEAARVALEESDQATTVPPLEPATAGEPIRADTSAQAAAAASGSDRGLAGLAGELRRALDALDEPAAQAVLDRLFAAFTIEAALRQVLMPYLHNLGDRWANHENDTKAKDSHPAHEQR